MKLNKLFTASLLAILSMGAYACGGDDDDSCTDGKYKECANETTAVMCVGGEWVNVDCAKASKVCSSVTHECVESSGGNGGDGSGNGGNGGNGGDGSGNGNTSADCTGKLPSGGKVGDPCDKACYKQTCINGGANALVCWDDAVKQWDCATCQDAGYDSTKPLQVKCQSNGGGSGSGDACTATSTSGCAPACDPDGTKGYYWSNTDGLKTYTCFSGKTCQISESNRVECVCTSGDCSGGGSSTSCEGKLERGGNVGDPCEKACYTQTCTNGGANALVCWDNVVTQWSCAETCQDAGYDSSKPLQVNCPKGSGGTSTACSDADYVGTCADDHKTAVVCVKGVTKNYTCFNDICETRTDGTIYCPRDQEAVDNEAARRECEASSAEKLTSGGKPGDCCDTENYVPAGCNTDTNSGLRCSTGVIVEWTCDGGKTCSFDASSTEYAGGKYSCI